MTNTFLNHEDTRNSVIALQREAAYAQQMLDFWMNDSEINNSIKRSKLPLVVKHLGVAFLVKACRQFQSAIELSKRQEAQDTAIIARSMFELWLATIFVLRSSVSLP